MGREYVFRRGNLLPSHPDFFFGLWFLLRMLGSRSQGWESFQSLSSLNDHQWLRPSHSPGKWVNQCSQSEQALVSTKGKGRIRLYIMLIFFFFFSYYFPTRFSDYISSHEWHSFWSMCSRWNRPELLSTASSHSYANDALMLTALEWKFGMWCREKCASPVRTKTSNFCESDFLAGESWT